MQVSPSEAEEALVAIQGMVQKTRRVISSSGAYRFLIVWGVIWLLGFSASQFLSGPLIGYTWAVLNTLGGILSAIIGIRMNRGVRSTSSVLSGRRIGIFYLLLFLFCYAAVAVVWPVDSKQLAMIIVLFVMVGWVAMSLLLSFASIWWALALTGLSLAGFFLLPDIFYLWMAILGGGGMIALGFYIRSRW
jgi:uncharacterized membrane protein (DUF485 family)